MDKRVVSRCNVHPGAVTGRIYSRIHPGRFHRCTPLVVRVGAADVPPKWPWKNTQLRNRNRTAAACRPAFDDTRSVCHRNAQVLS